MTREDCIQLLRDFQSACCQTAGTGKLSNKEKDLARRVLREMKPAFIKPPTSEEIEKVFE
jgi:hypothetical protein